MLHFVRVEALNVQISKLSLSLRVGVGQVSQKETTTRERYPLKLNCRGPDTPWAVNVR
jgi:hypothetical protein